MPLFKGSEQDDVSPHAYWPYSLLALMLLAPFVYALLHAVPEADDFSRAVCAQGLFDVSCGLRETVRTWLEHGGRYTHHFLVYTLGAVFIRPWGAPLVCITSLALYWAGFFGIFSTLSKRGASGESFFFATLALLCLVAGVESFDTAYMLATDALGISLGNGLLLLFLWMLCLVWFSSSRWAWRAASGAVLSGAIAVGCYEHAALATITAAATAMAMALLYRHPHRRQFAVVLALVAVFTCIALFAPGNFVRREHRGGTPGHILAAFTDDGKDVAEKALQLGYIATALAVSCLLRPRWRQSLTARLSLPVVLLLGALGYALFMGGIVFFHALADFQMTVAHKLVASCVLLGAYWAAFVILACGDALRRAVRSVPHCLLILPVMGLLALSPLYQKTLVNALGGTISDYYRIQAGRWDWLRTRPGQDVALPVPEVSPYPMYTLESLWPYSRAAGEWPNPDAARVYGVKSITRQPLSVEAAYNAIRAAHGDIPAPQEPAGHTQSRIFFSVNPGPNELFERDWLFLRLERPVSRISTLLLLEPERGRLVPRSVQSRVTPAFAAKEQLTPGFFTSLLGPVRAFEPERWLVPGQGGAAYLLPLRKPTKHTILAAYVSIDGGSFRRVYAGTR